jgi:pimeloyl-ACP methyl ester carboxylesterase
MADLLPASALSAKRPWHHPIELAQTLVIYPVIGYATICVYLLSMQTRMIYVGATNILSREAAIREANAAGLVPWEHTTPGAAGPQGYVRPNFADPAPRGTIVFFHGNGESAWVWTDVVDALTERGFRVFLYEYPGYGGRPGRPGEAAIVPDARAVIRSLAQAGKGPVYVWGQSLGAGVAAAVCADDNLPVEGLTLVAPWDNIANVALTIYPYLPIRFLMVDKYDSIANLKQFRHPICVIRGDQDETIPPSLSLNLFANLPGPKKMILMEGYGHDNWLAPSDMSWWDDALNFMAPRK